MTIFSGAERRRRWSEAEKIDLVVRAFTPGAVVAQVARDADVHPCQLYRWRKEFSVPEADAPDGFAQVVVRSEGSPPDRGCAIRVRVGSAQVEIAEHAPGELAAVVLRALVR